MDKKDIVLNFIKGIEKGEQEFGNYLSDSFAIQIPIPMPIGKSQVLMFAQMISTSVPDLSLSVSDINENGDSIIASVKASGSYQNNFMGLISVPAGGQKIDLPVTQFEFIFLGDKINEIKLPNFPLAQIGSLLGNSGFSLPGMN